MAKFAVAFTLVRFAVLALAVAACGGKPAEVAPSKRASDGADAAGGDVDQVAGSAAPRRRPSGRVTDPAGTVVHDNVGWLAIFTDGAYSVRLRGPSRTFAEATAKATVTTTTWVRALPTPFAGAVDEAWLSAALADTSADLLAMGAQYLPGAPALFDENGLQIAGDASYGPVEDAGTKTKSADFNDYLGVPWTFPGSVSVAPEPTHLHSVDCSGYMRLLWGFRAKLPLAMAPRSNALAIPRTSAQMLTAGPGVVLIANQGRQVTDFSPLIEGDIVFFDARTDDGPSIDHVGMFLGRDADGHYRFLSSRKSSEGPTLGDANGPSLLDGTGLFAVSFRAARRF